LFLKIINWERKGNISKFQTFYWQNQQKTCFWPLTNTTRLWYVIYT